MRRVPKLITLAMRGKVQYICSSINIHYNEEISTWLNTATYRLIHHSE
jgi:hypothetical protein